MMTRALPIVAALVMLTLASEAAAEFNHFYPRTRFFSELGRDSNVGPSVPGRRSNARVQKKDFDNSAVYDLDRLRFGGMVGWSSNYVWRDYLLSESASIVAAEAHASWYGADASLFVTEDTSDDLNASGSPYQMDARLSYTFKALTSFNTIAVTYHDFSNVHTRIGTIAQGFDPGAKAFPDTTYELHLSSYWFEDSIQINSSNYYLGLEGWAKLKDDFGARAQATIGISATNVAGEPLLPNGARLQGSLVYQYEYYRSDANFPGAILFGDIYWDLGESDLPLMFVIACEYFTQIEKEAKDRLTFFVRAELKF